MFNLFNKKPDYKPQVNNILTPMISINSSGLILYSNMAADDLFNLSNAEGSNITDLVSADLPSMITGSLSSVRKAFKLTSSDKYVEITSQSVQPENYFVLTFFDVTKDYNLMNKLIEYRTNMDNLGKNKNMFLAQMTNVFKSPMHSVMGYAQAILEGMGGETDERQKKYLSIIYKDSEELFKLLDKVTELAKVEAHLIDFSYKNYNIQNLINDLQADYLPSVNDKGLKLNINMDDLTQKVIYGDETILKTILMHLLDNAILSCDFGTINIYISDKEFIERQENSIKIRITDPGAPTRASEMQYVFNPYYQPDKKNRIALIKSLGICIVGNLIGQMNGHITAETDTSGFTITIPTDKRIEPAVKVE